MISKKAKALLKEAAAPTLERVAKDSRGAPRQLLPLLSYIHEHLFQPELNVARLKRATNVRNNLVPVIFHRELGLSPKAYISDCRLEVAARLLRGSDLLVWQIAELVGYSSLPVFSRAFRAWAGGVSPREYRKQNDPLPQVPDEWFSSNYLRRALCGDLGPSEAKTLLGFLEGLYDTSANDQGSTEQRLELNPEDLRRNERLRAEEFWRGVASLPQDRRMELVRGRTELSCEALFETLRESSRREGRRDREEGVRIAKLAVLSLEGAAVLGERLPSLEARGYAWLANAQRLALDFPAAERSFARAESSLTECSDRLVEAELATLKSGLRLAQHRFEEAREPIDEAVRLLRNLDRPGELARALALRARCHFHGGVFDHAISDLCEARILCEALEEPLLGLSIQNNLALAYVESGDAGKAEKALILSRELCRRVDYPIMAHQLCWTEGRFAEALGHSEDAEGYLREALRGFVALGEMGHAAAASLDLAILLERQGLTSEVVALAAETVPVFQALRLQNEGLVAFHMLKEGLEAGMVTGDILRHLRGLLGDVLQVQPMGV